MTANRAARSVFAVLALWIAAAGGARAHAIFVASETRGDVVVVTVSDDAGPRAAISVTVFGPAGGGTTHQRGETDQQGRFAFVPNVPGEWQAVIDDGFGHRAVARVTVAETAGALAAVDGNEAGLGVGGRVSALVTGVSLLVGITGVAFWLLARRERRRQGRP